MVKRRVPIAIGMVALTLLCCLNCSVFLADYGVKRNYFVLHNSC